MGGIETTGKLDYDEQIGILENVRFPEPFDYEAVGRLVIAAMVKTAGAGRVEFGKDGGIVDVSGTLEYALRAQVSPPADPQLAAPTDPGSIWGMLCVCFIIEGRKCCVGPGCP